MAAEVTDDEVSDGETEGDAEGQGREEGLLMAKRPTVRAGSDDVIPPPSSMTVDYEPKPVLHLPNGKVLVRRPGF